MATKALQLVERSATELHRPPQNDTDQQIIGLWLHGRPAQTRRAYEADIRFFFKFVGKPLAQISLVDVQAFKDVIALGTPSTQSRKISAVKSLLSFGHETGYLPFNVGAAVKAPAVKNTLAERILNEHDVQRMLALEPKPRDRVLLRLLYLAGLRISELCDLKVRDLADNGDAGQITVFGKGGKTRVILLKLSIWVELQPFRSSNPDAPVFRSRQEKGKALDSSRVHQIVKKAAARAHLSDAVSAHWLRHAHASHSLDRGAPVHLVQTTLGHASLATTSRYTHARPNDSSSRYLAG